MVFTNFMVHFVIMFVVNIITKCTNIVTRLNSLYESKINKKNKTFHLLTYICVKCCGHCYINMDLKQACVVSIQYAQKVSLHLEKSR